MKNGTAVPVSRNLRQHLEDYGRLNPPLPQILVNFSLTLLVFIFQFRSQETAIKESSYQNLMDRYNDFMMVQAEKLDLSKLLKDWLGRDAETKIPAEDVSVVANLLIAYGIVEEAFSLYSRRWIDIGAVGCVAQGFKKASEV